MSVLSPDELRQALRDNAGRRASLLTDYSRECRALTKLLKQGRGSGLPVSEMSRLAEISRETAHVRLRS